MTVAFIVVGAIGLVLLTVGLVFGGLLDLFDVTGGLLSLTPVGAALAIFAAVGFIAAGTGADDRTSLLVGGGAGILSLVAGAVLTRHFQKISAGSTVDYNLVGATAIVTSDVDEEGGEVHVEDSRESGRRLATSAVALETGRRVRVIGHTANAVRVAPYVPGPGDSSAGSNTPRNTPRSTARSSARTTENPRESR